MTFTERLVGAALLNSRVYEDVEADRGATGQAAAVVLMASVAAGIGLWGLGVPDPRAFASHVIGALVGWVAWGALTYLIGTRLLPEAQTRADVGELLRTIAFASSPGLLRVFGVIPFLGWLIYMVTSVWMLLAMVVAVRQALDYKSTARAISVCIVGWVLSLVVALIFGTLFAPAVS